MKRAALLARQPQAGLRHPFAQGLARNRQPIVRRQLLGRQRRTEIRIAPVGDGSAVILEIEFQRFKMLKALSERTKRNRIGLPSHRR